MLALMDDFEIRALRQEARDKEREKWFIAAKDQERQKEIKAEQAEDDLLDFAASVILATEMEIAEFQAKLDTYDEATVKALMENQRQLDKTQARIDEMLSNADIMEDGTRVFKSEDGTWAVDEHGNRLDSQTHDMDAILPTKNTAEEYLETTERKHQLMQERQAILDYQEKLDNARERSNADDFAKEELDELEAELDATMPTAVRRQQHGYELSQETSLKSDFTSSVEIEQVATIPNADQNIDLGMVPQLR